MRKIILIILTFLLIISIFGCGNKNEPNKVDAEPELSSHTEIVEAEPEILPIIAKEPLIKKEKELPGAFIVSVDNHRNAYPQSGLDKADRVYEILAEGGITRYLAVFHSQKADKIGPIRSARYYFAYIVKGHDFPFAHAGGNTNALNLIPQLKIKDLDEIYNSGPYFLRDKSRKMPHNLYSSTDLLLKGAEKKKFSLLPLEPLEQGKLEGGDAVDLIDITYSTDPRYLYTVTYEWGSGRYKRYINGVPHKTQEGLEIFTENIVVLETKTREVVTNELESEIELIGGGKALFFTGGNAYEGTWKKEKAASEFTFIYQGKNMKFIGEHAWINIVPALKNVEVTKV